jgi:hypothetical protein
MLGHVLVREERYLQVYGLKAAPRIKRISAQVPASPAQVHVAIRVTSLAAEAFAAAKNQLFIPVALKDYIFGRGLAAARPPVNQFNGRAVALTPTNYFGCHGLTCDIYTAHILFKRCRYTLSLHSTPCRAQTRRM